ncbi:flavin reductase family protein [Chitinophaga solisilvae]|uniref:flavin reductase family protein n=1 Tax=Chitinophaga solisilvae TaxID=1233460 RepID=UPI00136A3201|nr:iron-sulfur cluster-binding domain-containing protein [Chitinophaga solisilvae]
MSSHYTWYTKTVIPETPDSVTIVFDTRGVPFRYEAGQFIQVTLVIDGQPVTRSYSLSSSPDTDVYPAITVKRIPGGLMSNHIFNMASTIGEWQIEGPLGAFTLREAACRHLVLLGGGSGITPLYAIARSAIQQHPGLQVTLLYSSSTAADTIFKTQLDQWQQQQPNNIRIHYVLSRHPAGEAAAENNIIAGRINRIIAKKLVKQAIAATDNNAHYFICGPAELMKMHEEALTSVGVPETHIRKEWYAPEAVTGITLPDTTQEVLLHLYEQTNLLEVKPGMTILDAALEDKIPLPYSCRGGTCGKCAARLSSGKVQLLENYALRQEDLDAGLILLCRSYPLDSQVTVEVDG